jgi:hypothetical protein
LPSELPQPPNQVAAVSLAVVAETTHKSNFDKQFEKASEIFQSAQGALDEQKLGEAMTLLEPYKIEALSLVNRLQVAVDAFAQKMKDEADKQDLPKLSDAVALERRKLAVWAPTPGDGEYWRIKAVDNAVVAFEKMAGNVQVAGNKYMKDAEPAQAKFEGQLRDHKEWAETQLENSGTEVQSELEKAGAKVKSQLENAKTQVESQRILSAMTPPSDLTEVEAQVTKNVDAVVDEVQAEVAVVQAEAQEIVKDVRPQVADVEAEVQKRAEEFQEEFQAFLDGPLRAQLEQLQTENLEREQALYPFANELYKTVLREVTEFQQAAPYN